MYTKKGLPVVVRMGVRTFDHTVEFGILKIGPVPTEIQYETCEDKIPYPKIFDRYARTKDPDPVRTTERSSSYD